MVSPFQNGSLFHALSMREVRPCKVRGRPSMRGLSSEGGSSGSGVLSVESNGVPAPPLAVAYGMDLLPDVHWDSTRLCTLLRALIRPWDVESHATLRVMRGHCGSVKSLCAHPSNRERFASGSRDGSVALWDLRTSTSNELSFSVMHEGYPRCSKVQERSPKGKGDSHSVTAVLYQRDERILATSGATDGSVPCGSEWALRIVKFWDTRKLKVPVVQTPQQKDLSEGVSTSQLSGRVHDIASLSQDPTSSRLRATCADSKIYMYAGAFPDRGVMSSFSGRKVGSCYIKAAFSPDGAHIVSGSSDNNVYVWQVDYPFAAQVVLEGHRGEVTSVDWCSSSSCKIGTSSDDCMVRVWSLKEHQFTPNNCRLICQRRRRITAQLPIPPSKANLDIIPETPPCKLLNSQASTPTLVVDGLSELNPNVPHGSDPGGKRNVRLALSSALEARKRPRTILDYFSTPYSSFKVKPGIVLCNTVIILGGVSILAHHFQLIRQNCP